MRTSAISRTAGTRAAAAGLVAVLVGALSFGGAQVWRLHEASQHRHERSRVLEAVRAEVIALTNISATTTDKQIGHLLGGMTQHMKGQLASQADAFRQAMVQSKVQSRGSVVAVGLTSISARRASAVVAAAARVSNSRTAGDQDRSYRLRLTLRKVAGRWLVDEMEFVS
jgi:Mce-associated membrane protein